MSELQAEIAQVEGTIEEAEAMIARADALRRLMHNPDYLAIFEEDYLKAEAVRLTHLYADPALKDKLGDIQNSLIGISTFRQYLSMILIMGNQAHEAIVQNKELLDDLHAETYVSEHTDEEGAE